MQCDKSHRTLLHVPRFLWVLYVTTVIYLKNEKMPGCGAVVEFLGLSKIVCPWQLIVQQMSQTFKYILYIKVYGIYSKVWILWTLTVWDFFVVMRVHLKILPRQKKQTKKKQQQITITFTWLILNHGILNHGNPIGKNVRIELKGNKELFLISHHFKERRISIPKCHL